jgi:tetratricopeptide (TPR) repeat protein
MYEEQEKLYRQCKDLYNRNDYINGLNIINKIVDDYNHNNNELFYEDKIDNLIKFIDINIENNIEKEKAYKCKAFLLYKNNQYKESIKYFREIINVPIYQGSIYLFYFFMACSEYKLYKYKEALEYFDMAIIEYERAISRYVFDYVRLHNNKANTLQNLGRYDEAIEEYNKVINNMDIKESKYVILNNKGYCLQKLDKLEEALETYNDSITAINDCKNYEAYCYRTILLEKLKKDNSEIENSFNKFLDIINNNLSNKNFQRSYDIFSLILLIKNRLNKKSYEEIIDKMLTNDFSIKIKCDIENNSLYNYTSININTIKSILNEQLWLSHTNSFNDPVDPSIKQFKKYKEDYNYLLDSIKVGCLTTKKDNTLMWSHYADNHRGICIEYDIGKIYEKDNLIINKVNYNMPIITNKSIADNEILEIDNINRLIELFSLKSNEWKYEKEYRILYYDKERKKDGILIDCPIKSICFGTETSEDDKKLIRKIIKNKKGNKIEFKEAKFKQDKLFEINIEDYKAN